MNTITGYLYYPDSLVEADGLTCCLARDETGTGKVLVVLDKVRNRRAAMFQDGRRIGDGLFAFPQVPENARALRDDETQCSLRNRAAKNPSMPEISGRARSRSTGVVRSVPDAVR